MKDLCEMQSDSIFVSRLHTSVKFCFVFLSRKSELHFSASEATYLSECNKSNFLKEVRTNATDSHEVK